MEKEIRVINELDFEIDDLEVQIRDLEKTNNELKSKIEKKEMILKEIQEIIDNIDKKEE